MLFPHLLSSRRMLFNLPSLQTHNAARMPLTHVYQQLPYVRDLLKSMLASSLFYPQSTSPFLKSVPVNLPLRVNGSVSVIKAITLPKSTFAPQTAFFQLAFPTPGRVCSIVSLVSTLQCLTHLTGPLPSILQGVDLFGSLLWKSVS